MLSNIRMLFLTLCLCIVAFAQASSSENAGNNNSSQENRLLTLEATPSQASSLQTVAFVLGDDDEVIPVRRNLDSTNSDADEVVAYVLGDDDEAIAVDNAGSGRRNLATQPTNADQYMLELINAFRANPQATANDLLGGDLNQGLPADTISTDPKPPLAFNFELWVAAQDHSDWMLAQNVFSHTGRDGTSPTQRMQAAGYILTPPWSTGENIAYRGTTGAPDLVAFTKKNNDNLIISPGHRRNLMSESFKELGVSNVAGQFNNYNAVMTTQKFAFTGNNGPFITGVVYTDATDNDFYDVGEGIAGVIITAEDKQNPANKFTTTSIGTGGYILDVDPSTEYKVTFSGDLRDDGMSTTAIYEVSVGMKNVKQDCVSDNLPNVVATNPPTLEPTLNPTTTLQPTSNPTTTLQPTSNPTTTLQPTSNPTTTLQPTSNPTTNLQPTSNPTTSSFEPTRAPTVEPSQSVDGYIACGKKNKCNDQTRVAGADERHAVRCASDTKISGWKKRCGIWSESNAWGTCENSLSYTEAKALCEREGGRLPTVTELENNCLRGTGCGHDRRMVWAEDSEQ